jgi:ATP-dependent DNA helicase PIF1
LNCLKKEIFGAIAAYVYVIEHKKKGLPHAHFLIILKKDWTIIAPETFDDIVSAELPNKYENSHLYSVVVKHMMHGPYGILNPNNMCMKKDGTYKNHMRKVLLLKQL